MKQTTKIYSAIAISSAFFIVEIVLGFRQRSLALVADAFHVASDIIGFIVALVARILADRKTGIPLGFSYGLQRGPILGAFFNGCFLGGLGFSIVLQSIERLIFPEEVREPKLVLIVGAVGLGLNIISALVVHDHGEHGHSHGHGHAHKLGSGSNTPSTAVTDTDAESGKHAGIPMHAQHEHATRALPKGSGYDLGLLGVMIHLLGDAINNIFVIASAAIIWKTGFLRADGIASLLVGLMIIGTALPLMKNSGRLLFEAAPQEMDLPGMERDIMRVEGIEGVHEMHVFSLTQTKHIASLHVVVLPGQTMGGFMEVVKHLRECLHAWGLHGGVTIQPELAGYSRTRSITPEVAGSSSLAQSGVSSAVEMSDSTGIRSTRCQIPCASDQCATTACCS